MDMSERMRTPIQPAAIILEATTLRSMVIEPEYKEKLVKIFSREEKQEREHQREHQCETKESDIQLLSARAADAALIQPAFAMDDFKQIESVEAIEPFD